MTWSSRAVYKRPLEKSLEGLVELDKRMLNKVGRTLVKEVQREILRQTWGRDPNNLVKSIKFRLSGNRIIIFSDHPAAKYLEEGVDPHPMEYLTSEAGPVPLTKQGSTNFRTPPKKGDPSWQHPGIKAKKFIERGVRKGRTRALATLAKEIVAKASR